MVPKALNLANFLDELRMFETQSFSSPPLVVVVAEPDLPVSVVGMLEFKRGCPLIVAVWREWWRQTDW
jgi:hypothetical protein